MNSCLSDEEALPETPADVKVPEFLPEDLAEAILGIEKIKKEIPAISKGNLETSGCKSRRMRKQGKHEGVEGGQRI